MGLIENMRRVGINEIKISADNEKLNPFFSSVANIFYRAVVFQESGFNIKFPNKEAYQKLDNLIDGCYEGMPIKLATLPNSDQETTFLTYNGNAFVSPFGNPYAMCLAVMNVVYVMVSVPFVKFIGGKDMPGIPYPSTSTMPLISARIGDTIRENPDQSLFAIGKEDLEERAIQNNQLGLKIPSEDQIHKTAVLFSLLYDLQQIRDYERKR